MPEFDNFELIQLQLALRIAIKDSENLKKIDEARGNIEINQFNDLIEKIEVMRKR